MNIEFSFENIHQPLWISWKSAEVTLEEKSCFKIAKPFSDILYVLYKTRSFKNGENEMECECGERFMTLRL